MVKMSLSLDNVDIRPSNRACRCLFGMPDRDELQETLRKEKAELIQQDKDRWGFDFASEQPIPGSKYQWTRQVSSAGDVSHQQHQLIFTGKRKSEESVDDLVREKGFKVLVTESKSDNECDNKDASSQDSASSPSTSRQSKVTDFFQIRKCPSPDKN